MAPAATAGAAALNVSLGTVKAENTVRTVGTGTDASAGTPAIGAGVMVGGHPGDSVRLVAVAGGGTSAGATITVRICGRNAPKL